MNWLYLKVNTFDPYFIMCLIAMHVPLFQIKLSVRRGETSSIKKMQVKMWVMTIQLHKFIRRY